MDVFEAIDKRRSVRGYLPEPVPDGILKEIFEAVKKAPSAKNFQPLKFIVITDRELKEKLIPVCREQKFIAEAPLVIVGCAKENECYEVMGSCMKSYAVDLAIAFDHLTLAARAKGLGTCWIGNFSEKGVKKTLGIKDRNVRIIALTPLGYPKSWPEAKSRKTLSELITYNVYK